MNLTAAAGTRSPVAERIDQRNFRRCAVDGEITSVGARACRAMFDDFQPGRVTNLRTAERSAEANFAYVRSPR